MPDFLKIPLDRIDVDEANVRNGVEADDKIGQLIASIRSVGLIQPLVVTPRKGDIYGVVAGRRRLYALQQLLAEGAGPKEVTCLVVGDANAAEISLAENYVREAMSTKQLYDGMRSLAEAKPDTPVEAIADAFGIDTDRARRILRLANVHPAILEAWDKQDLRADQVQAYGMTDNVDAQKQVFDSVPRYAGPQEIKTRLRGILNIVNDGKSLAYVGTEAYTAAGGRLATDLFSDEQLVLDPDILAKLTIDKLKVEKEEVELRLERADGGDLNVRWDDKPPLSDQYRHYELEVGLGHRFEPDDQAMIDGIKTHLDNLHTELEELGVEDWMISNGQLRVDAREELNESDIERIDEILPKLAELIEEHNEVSKRARPVIPAGKGAVVLVAKINADGQSSFDAYYASFKDAGIDKKEPAETKKAADLNPAEEQKKQLGMSRTGWLAAEVAFADFAADMMIAHELTPYGLDGLLFSLARGFTWNYDKGLVGTRDPERGGHKVSELLGDLETSFKDDLLRVFPDASWFEQKDIRLAWDGYLAWIDPFKRNTFGAIILKHRWSPLASSYREEPRPTLIDLVAHECLRHYSEDELALLAVKQRDLIIDLMSHKARLATMEDWGVSTDSLKALKKATSGDFMRKVIANRDHALLVGVQPDVADTLGSWLPSQLYAAELDRPKPKPAPKKRTAKGKKK